MNNRSLYASWYEKEHCDLDTSPIYDVCETCGKFLCEECMFDGICGNTDDHGKRHRSRSWNHNGKPLPDGVFGANNPMTFQKIEWKFVETDGTPEWQEGDFSFPCIAAYDSDRARGIVTVPAYFANHEFYWGDGSNRPLETEYRKVIAWLPIPRFYGEYNGQTYESGHVVKEVE